jgi:integrase/recombinase XerD
MNTALARSPNSKVLTATGNPILPAIIADAGEHAARRYIEFFTATIRNGNTRRAYGRAVADFLAWCQLSGLTLSAIEPVHVAAYIEQLTRSKAVPTVKQHLAAIGMLLDWLTSGGILPFNPAAKHVVKRGKTPVLTAKEARDLLDSIVPDDPAFTPTLIDLRDRALIGVMVFSFARVSAATGMQVADYYVEGRKAWFRLYEKGGKRHEVPAHHNAADYVDAYIAAAGIAAEKKSPRFRSIDRHRTLASRPLDARNALDMVKRRAIAIGLPETTCCHTFRATGITAYLEEGGTIEHAQRIANHESPKTTKLYDRTSDQIDLDEIERIRI